MESFDFAAFRRIHNNIHKFDRIEYDYQVFPQWGSQWLHDFAMYTNRGPRPLQHSSCDMVNLSESTTLHAQDDALTVVILSQPFSPPLS